MPCCVFCLFIGVFACELLCFAIVYTSYIFFLLAHYYSDYIFGEDFIKKMFEGVVRDPFSEFVYIYKQMIYIIYLYQSGQFDFIHNNKYILDSDKYNPYIYSCILNIIDFCESIKNYFGLIKILLNYSIKYQDIADVPIRDDILNIIKDIEEKEKINEKHVGYIRKKIPKKH